MVQHTSCNINNCVIILVFYKDNANECSLSYTKLQKNRYHYYIMMYFLFFGYEVRKKSNFALSKFASDQLKEDEIMAFSIISGEKFGGYKFIA